MKAYLDIETSFGGEITVIGVFCPPDRVVQLVGEEVNSTNLWNALEGVSEILTYNGARFDLPVIKRLANLDLGRFFECRDLMYDCWKRDLFGGLKKVEEQLGIERASKGIDGMEAMRLWERYRYDRDENALNTLLEYNRDDIVNLFHLEKHLKDIPPRKKKNRRE